MTTDLRSVSSPAVPDYGGGIKKQVAEVKFLIHDLRVEGFFNDILHYHVTLNTDLEIYNIEQAQVLHGADVQELKGKLGALRRAYQDYSNAVKSFSPDRTILLLGRRYIETIREACELILNPLWGRSDKVLAFLPDDARSVRSRRHYRNCIVWLYGVHWRIEAFLEELEHPGAHEEFDIAEDIRDFTRDVVVGYVVEKSESRVELQLDRLDPAVIVGNRQRFRRMYFNLVMNAVDAMSGRRAGVLNVSAVIEDDRVALRVRDDGMGMSPEKIQQLLADRQSLDGELHSLGFVFVRQTVAQFGGDLAIESTVGRGTTMTLRLPYLPGMTAESLDPSRRDKYRLPQKYRSLPAEGGLVEFPSARVATAAAEAPAPAQPVAVRATEGEERERQCGKLVFEAYRRSKAQFPGCIFAIAVTEEDRVEMFTVKHYDRDWDISHEDLSPMHYLATYRGRIEEDELKKPILILKPPQSVREYFEFKEVPEADRGLDRFTRMVRDEGIRIARKLIATGLAAQIQVHLASASRFFPAPPELHGTEPFPLDLLARQKLSAEES
ncbi:MAG: ATP-binding protein [Betaproteobacteria bacterium]|nr:ATP-binding protein [Betaproteobacteria bacterium]